jgi:hypothetical protein
MLVKLPKKNKKTVLERTGPASLHHLTVLCLCEPISARAKLIQLQRQTAGAEFKPPDRQPPGVRFRKLQERQNHFSAGDNIPDPFFVEHGVNRVVYAPIDAETTFAHLAKRQIRRMDVHFHRQWHVRLPG